MKNTFQKFLDLLPSKDSLHAAISKFSKKEYGVFIVLLAILTFASFWMIQNINKSFMVEVPMKGGSISEGIIGTPRFVNPVLAFSDVDQDLVTLIYSGLMRKDNEGGLAFDLAESYEIENNGLSFVFTLKDEIYFHNGEEVTADDVVFTIEKVKDSTIKSPRKGSWDGITVEKIDERTIRFNLQQSYASFLETTVLGIMPKSVWDDTPIELNEANISPIGAGPYKVEKISKQANGLVEHYELRSFSEWSLGQPYLNEISLKFYANEADLISGLTNGAVNQISSITPANAELLREKGYITQSLTLPRVFGLFFNHNQNQIFLDKNVINAIELAINKKRIIDEVLLGYGVILDGPIPSSISGKDEIVDYTFSEENIKSAEELLEKNGWKKGEDGILEKTTKTGKETSTAKLSFSIATGNAPELSQTAEMIKFDLERVGMQVEIKTFEIGNLNQSVIRPREYDALLFGQIVNHESDLFAFWHSSQRKDPGLNVAMYTNARVDKILEEASITVDEKNRRTKYTEFEKEIKNDKPVVFLYSPEFIYVISKDLKGFELNNIISPADRLLNSHLWYTKTDKVWEIFSQELQAI